MDAAFIGLMIFFLTVLMLIDSRLRRIIARIDELMADEQVVSEQTEKLKQSAASLDAAVKQEQENEHAPGT